MRLAVHDYSDSAPTTEVPAIGWEERACPLCENDDWEPVLEAAGHSRNHGGLRFLIVKCTHCGLCFTNPRPNVESIRQFYPADYHCHCSHGNGAKDRFWKADPMRKLLPVVGKGRLLDFGCGAGDFLQRMREIGWNAVGLDPAADVVAHIREERGLPAHAGTLPQPRWTAASFDAITMWQSLEHVHDPVTVLRDAHRLLTPGGRLLVTVPNLESLSAQWFGASWYGLDVPRHLTHFTVETLRGILQQSGFEWITIQQENRNSWIRHSAEARRDRSWLTWLLTTRAGSGLAGCWGRVSGRAESLLAIAVKR